MIVGRTDEGEAVHVPAVTMVFSVLFAASLSISQTDMVMVSNLVHRMTEFGRLVRGGWLNDA